MSPLRLALLVLAAALAAGTFLPSALASGASLRVRPTAASPGNVVVFTGSVGEGCSHGDRVTLISRLFPGHAFGGEGAITARVGTHDHFSRSFRVRAGTAHKKYVVTARCGGGNLGVSATLRVH